MRPLSPTPQGTDAVQARSRRHRRLALAALVFLLPWTASALDRGWFTAAPEPGRAEAFAVRLGDDMLMSSRLGDLTRGDLSLRQDEKEREGDELERRMAVLDQEERELRPEEDAIGKVKRQIDARRDVLVRTLDATLLRLLEQAIAEGS